MKCGDLQPFIEVSSMPIFEPVGGIYLACYPYFLKIEVSLWGHLPVCVYPP
jgi:hypothetical protein